MQQQETVLIIGGYGVFGGRLVRLLEDEPGLRLIVAGRSVAKAEAFCRERGKVAAQLQAAHFDRNGHVIAQLEALQPTIVVDASGPFQNYGEDGYRVIEACLAYGCHYMDLADGAAFVAGAMEYDAQAKQAGVFIFSGVSSFPVLTALVVRELAQDLERVEAIHGGIAPSPYAGVGENVIRAIASYAGQPVQMRRKGKPVTGYPFTDTMRYTIAPPGYVPLRPILFSLVEVPDLHVLPQLWPTAHTVWMGAGPVPEPLHRALIGFAWLVRWRVLPSLLPLVSLIRWVMNTVRWGEHRGGMFVRVQGYDAAENLRTHTWHLLAEGSDGPLIPCMAVEAVMRKRLQGKDIPAGARAPIADLQLADYERIFAARTIYTGIRRDDHAASDAPLYKRILGAAWERLPAELKYMHSGAAQKVVGEARVMRGSSPLGNIIADAVGFPKTAEHVLVIVKFTVQDGEETWTRHFGNGEFSSRQYAGEGRASRLLVEQFGPMSFAMALECTEEGGEKRLQLVLRHWKLFGIPMPMWLCPHSDSYETVRDGVFHFHVRITHPLLGCLVHYEGWLKPAGGEA